MKLTTAIQPMEAAPPIAAIAGWRKMAHQSHLLYVGQDLFYDSNAAAGRASGRRSWRRRAPDTGSDWTQMSPNAGAHS
jgi:hypothetical protein